MCREEGLCSGRRGSSVGRRVCRGKEGKLSNT